MDPAGMVRDARGDSGMSVRELASRAGVSASTVLRVESGAMDPTVGMLRQILAAAGRDLALTSRRARRGGALADLHDACSTGPHGERPDWTRVRHFLDDLSRHPERASTAIARPPAPATSPFMAALLAGIADKVADDAGIRRPPWTRRVAPLALEWGTPGTPAIVKRIRSATPAQLAVRGIWIDEQSLWRSRATAS